MKELTKRLIELLRQRFQSRTYTLERRMLGPTESRTEAESSCAIEIKIRKRIRVTSKRDVLKCFHVLLPIR